MPEKTMPSTPQEVAAAVLDAIDAQPSTFNMRSWAWLGDKEELKPGEPECGTTMCAAGWAAHLTGWTLTYIKDEDGEGELLAEKDGDVRDIDDVGWEVLGIADYEYGSFFYEGEETAREHLERIAGRR